MFFILVLIAFVVVYATFYTLSVFTVFTKAAFRRCFRNRRFHKKTPMLESLFS